MQFLKFSKYFFYIASNWNLRIAFHIIRKEITGEKKYGINTTGADELQKLEASGIDVSHATIYMPASYDMLEEIFYRLRDKTFHHFIDIGCGKGRVLCVAAHYGISKVSGVDLSKSFCDESVRNLESTKAKFPDLQFRVFNNDAFYFDITPDVDCIFLFNPFDETIMSGVVENIEISLDKNPRDIIVIYFNPLNKELFINNGFKEMFHLKKLSYLEACILKKHPAKSEVHKKN
jgi:SAM-dependent methyltransferase